MACAAAILLAFQSTITSVFALTSTALYMGGTGHPLSIPQDTTEYIASYVAGASNRYVDPSGLCSGVNPGCAQVAVYTPEQFRFDTGLWDMTFDESTEVGRANLDACIRGIPCTVTKPPFTTTGPPESLTDSSYVTYGYSSSATVASNEKYYLIAHPPTGSTVSFVLIANPNRPNGGVLERFVGVYIPLVGVTFNGATPTNSPEPTPLTAVDIARQYDAADDFPTNPLNLLADVNALLGSLYLHPEQNYFHAGAAELQGQYQDTTYYLIPTTTLPLLMPLEQIPFIGPPLAAVFDPPLRVLIETAFDRTINPGQPTPAKYLYFPNPIKTAVDFLVAIPTGWDNGIASITGNPANRPFHTTPQPTYGVGGPPAYTGAIDPYGPPTPELATATPVQQAPAATAPVPATAGRSARVPAANRHIPSPASVAATPTQPARVPRALAGTPKSRGTPAHILAGAQSAA